MKIVDEFTGRVLEGRRYSEGLHQAIEAKESVTIKDENQTLATITLQNYFRLYEKLAGMTGTAETEAAELAQIYSLEVIAIPTNQAVAGRRGRSRLQVRERQVRSRGGRYRGRRRELASPCCSGLSRSRSPRSCQKNWSKRGIKHEVLNAKHHAREADIIAQAGRPGAVTVATNMAGRGVDIKLGGNPDGMARTELKRQGSPMTIPPTKSWNRS